MSELRGVLSAMATPFTPDASAVDEAGLRALTDATIAGGAHGLLPCGSTGEFTAMTVAERKLVTETVVDQAAGRVPVMPQTGALTTAEAIELTRHAEQSGAAAALLIAPYYEPLSRDEVRAYYAAVADATDIPLAVYNLPAGTGENLDPEWIAGLAREIPAIRYVKDSTGDLSQIGLLATAFADDVQVFNGCDTLLLPALQLGAAGAIIGAPNFLAREVRAVCDAFDEGRLADANAEWLRIFPALHFLIAGGYYAANIKTALQLVGRPAGPNRHPVAPLADEPRDTLEQLVGTLGLAAAGAAA